MKMKVISSRKIILKFKFCEYNRDFLPKKTGLLGKHFPNFWNHDQPVGYFKK